MRVGGLLSSLLRTNFKFSPVLGEKWLTLPDRDGAKSPGRAQTESRKHRRPGATVDSVGSELHCSLQGFVPKSSGMARNLPFLSNI